MDFLELCRLRYSCRGFNGEPLNPEDIFYVRECARLSPSARNCQPYSIIQVHGNSLADTIKGIQPGGANSWATGAALLWVIVEQRGDTPRNYTDYDSGILSATICYAAAQRGVGTCIIGCYDPDLLSMQLDIPKDKRIVMVIAAGYPDAKPRNARKKAQTELFMEEKYNG